MAREAGSPRTPLEGWRDLSPPSLVAAWPRWLNDTTIVYSGATTRDLHGAYTVSAAAPSRPRSLGRRNTPSANVPLRDGGVLYSQLDFTDPYRIRSDLYLDRRGRTRRLTRGARLSGADARPDGGIVAMQAVPGGARLVRVSADGRTVTPLTEGGADLQYMEPRWSPDGSLIAAATWRRGGISAIVVLDTLGRTLAEISPARAVQGAPSWSPDGRSILFSSDRGGTPDIYVASVPADVSAHRATAWTQTQVAPPIRLSDAPTGLFEPQLSPDGKTIGAVFFRADGYRVGAAPFRSADVAADSGGLGIVRVAGAPSLGPVTRDTSGISSYSPWASLRPRYWLPLVEESLGRGYRLGGMTSGQDLVGRHAYAGTLLVPTDNTGIVGTFDYRYAGLGQPVVGATLIQDWDVRARASDGEIRRRTQHAIVSATFARPRYRTSSSLTVGAGVQRRHFAVVPAELRPNLPAELQAALRDSTYPRAFLSGSWGNAYRTAYGISPEDGLTLNGSIDQRWGRGASASASRTYIGAVTGYKSLDLPGFARHVLALRVAGGLADRNATTTLEVGGVSGGVLSVLPGYAIGSGREQFPVRGFGAASLEGTRAAAGSLEYRLPLLIPGRGFRLLPFFLDRTSLSFFYDAAAAWCTTLDVASCYPVRRENRWLGAAGAELNVNAAILSWDVPSRFRFGVAHPVTDPVGAPPLTSYFTVGLSF
jgi:hypothetical protein